MEYYESIQKFQKFSLLLESLDTIQELIGIVKNQNDMKDKIERLNREDKQELLSAIKDINQKSRQRYSNMLTLYHGTTNPIATKILSGGFQLGKGKRSGFLGSEKVVNNLAIFLSDTKVLARAYGSNRDPHDGRDTRVLEVKANIKNPLDMSIWSGKIPRSIRDVALETLSEYEGRRITRPKQEDMFWMIDQPEIVEAIKEEGFDSVIFVESRATKKALGVNPKEHAATYAVFKPQDIHIVRDALVNMEDLYNHIVS